MGYRLTKRYHGNPAIIDYTVMDLPDNIRVVSTPLTYTSHATQRCYERGVDKDLIQELWDTGRFITYRNENGYMHAIAFINELHEYYEIVTRNNNVITIMPLIWREASVPDYAKLKAYSAANPTIKDNTELDVVESVPKKAPKIQVKFISEGRPLVLKYWPRGTEIDAVIDDLKRVPQYKGKVVEIKRGDSKIRRTL